jgi:hypothetical protein
VLDQFSLIHKEPSLCGKLIFLSLKNIFRDILATAGVACADFLLTPIRAMDFQPVNTAAIFYSMRCQILVSFFTV